MTMTGKIRYKPPPSVFWKKNANILLKLSIWLQDHTFDEKNEAMIDDKHKKLQTVHNWIGNRNKVSTKTLQALDELFREKK